MGNSASIPTENKHVISTVPDLGPIQNPKRLRAKLAFPKRVPTTNNKQKVLDEYPELKDALDYIQNGIKEINSYLTLSKTDKDKKTMNMADKKKLVDMFNFYFQFEDGEHKKLIGDQLAESNAGSMLIQYINILTDDGNDYPFENYNYNCFETVMGLCWNYSDVSPAFSVQLCQNGIVSMLLSTLKKFQFELSEHQEKNFVTSSAMSILHNCAGVDQNKKYYYDESELVDVIAWYAENTSQESNRDLAVVSAITLAEIVEEKDNDVILANDAIIKTILELLGRSLDEPDHRAEGYSATELASGLTRLANNAENSEVIVENGMLNHIRLMLFNGNDSEKIVAAEALWILAFSDKTKNKILADEEITNSLNEYSKAKIQKLQFAASGALWVLNQQFNERGKHARETNKEVLPGRPAKKNREATDIIDEDISKNDEVDYDERIDAALQETSGHVMISYQWDNQALMLKLKSKLEFEGYKVWLDLEEMGGSTLQAMADAVENAAVVLIGLSRRYKQSVNCRTEAEYAYKCQVPVIPLKLENGYIPDGWLGAIVGAKFYFEFDELGNFTEVFSNLKREIGGRGKKIQASNVTAVDAPSPTTQTETPIKNTTAVMHWSNADVVLWTKRNYFKNLKTKSLDGKVLLFLKRMKMEAPESFYRYAIDHLGLKDIRQLMEFTNTIAELR